ncbi:restriction endonuclease [Paenibacillus barcinonensis]|uniref:Restriction endonuclease n=1 Tax=Paenibacillus barcinonensis TaxID=198119 RepID=A0A2V4V7T2_PAEBA|nr:BsuBI/PstI family type II restriction endonuclease [Paenibacillus barcinonensis]PYE48779.1 BsuBI/PstI restriction endonuclease [Paenibacillus barcinonensis]QKS57793.1 restriction endonuclease [Paenibacillus barcinonensis]
MRYNWLSTEVPSVEEISRRLGLIFTKGLDPNGYILREIGAKTIFVMLYSFSVQGQNWIRPAIVTCMTDEQAQIKEEQARYSWLENNLNRKKKERDIPGRWYKENTRESIRDETIRTLVHLGAIIEKSGLATTSPAPRYTLQSDFVELFNTELSEEELIQAIANWQELNLSAIARARIAISKNMGTSIDDGVLVELPNGEVRKLSPGPSSDIAKAVVEKMAKVFLKEPAVLLISESAKKIVVNDDRICAAIGFHIDVTKVLPDIIMVDLGRREPLIVFVECVATDGPISDRRKLELISIAEEAGYSGKDYTFVTAFRDRTDGVSKKLTPSIAWDTFVWYATEPNSIIYMHEGADQSNISLGDILQTLRNN